MILSENKSNDFEAIRWQPPGFDAPVNVQPPAGDAFAPAFNPMDADYHEGISGLGQLPTAQDINLIREQAYQQSYQQGYHEGLEKSTADLNAVIKALHTGMEQLSVPLNEANEQVQQSLAQLAISIAEAILQQTLTLQPEQIMALVQRAVTLLPPSTTPIDVHLNPQDAEYLAKHQNEHETLKDFDLQIKPDADLNRGDCKVYADRSEITAILQDQIDTIAREILS